MKKIITSLASALAVLVLAGCNYLSQVQNTSAPAPAQKQAQNETAGSNVVLIQNFAFNPAAQTVKKGTTVTWTNNDSALHQIKSATFNSDKLSNGQSFSFTFNDVGTFDYVCAIHPSMQGKIIVE